MSMLVWVAAVGALIGAINLYVTSLNLARFRRVAEDAAGEAGTLVSVCVPARNEAANIEDCVRAALASDHANIEVLVYDDESTDGTGEIVARLSAEDPRVRAVPVVKMPAGWSGKQHACERMGQSARGEWVLFTDADVRLAPSAVRRALRFALDSKAELVSTFPRQVIGSVGELIHVPMMFFLLLGYLPMGAMRKTLSPSASAACGQFLFARRESYLKSGGHAAFKDSMHDGVKMPRAFRRAGMKTDLFDGTDLASVRMYRGFWESWAGFAKNAYEGLGSVGLLVFLTVLHVVGHILPWVIAPVAVALGAWWVAGIAGVGIALHVVVRWRLARRFEHSVLLAVLHPVTVAVMTVVQWHSLVLSVRGRRAWKGRTLGDEGGSGDAPSAGSVSELVSDADELVVLVDEADREVGTSAKIAAHEGAGALHRAFSVFVFDDDGRVLLQERARTKYHFGGLWTNACCGHPRPGEGTADAARRRLNEEMGIDVAVEPVGSFRYEAGDDGSGLVEREIDHVHVGRWTGEPVPNPAEASGHRWATPEQIDRELEETPGRFTPWFAPAWRIAREAAVTPRA